MTQVLDKPRKRKVETYTVDGVEIAFHQVEPDLGLSYHADPVPQQRSKWEVRVNGALVGFAFYPTGVGNPWVFTSLIPKACDYHAFTENYVHAWEDPAPNPDAGGHRLWARYSGLMGLLQPLVPWRQDTEPDKDHGQWADSEDCDWSGWTSRAQMADFIPRFMRAGRLPDPARTVEIIAEAKQDKIDRAERARLKAIQDKAEREAQTRIREQRERERQQLNADTLEGLKSIQDRLGASLTNFEAAALAEAIKRAGG